MASPTLGSADKNLYAVDIFTGRERWHFKTDGQIQSSPALAGGLVYVGSDEKNLYAVDANTGKERWHFATGGFVVSSPVVVNE